MAALAGGVVLASDVFESGAAVDRLLFGTLLALGPADLTLSAVTVALVAIATVALGPDLGGDRVRPRRRPLPGPARRARRLPAAGAGGRGGGRRDPGGRAPAGRGDLRPARRRRPAGRAHVPALLAWSAAFALAQGLLGLYVAYWLDLPPGPPVAVIGSLTYALLAVAR